MEGATDWRREELEMPERTGITLPRSVIALRLLLSSHHAVIAKRNPFLRVSEWTREMTPRQKHEEEVGERGSAMMVVAVPEDT